MRRQITITNDTLSITREKINELFDSYEKNYDEVSFDLELDWNGCYYPGESPSIQITWYGVKK